MKPFRVLIVPAMAAAVLMSVAGQLSTGGLHPATSHKALSRMVYARDGLEGGTSVTSGRAGGWVSDDGVSTLQAWLYSPVITARLTKQTNINDVPSFLFAPCRNFCFHWLPEVVFYPVPPSSRMLLE
jgi:hypothetical protein